MEKMWALLIPLSRSWEMPERAENRIFDESVWEEIVAELSHSAVITVVFDLLDGMRYQSHPELALPGAWSRERMKEEIRRLKAMGIRSIPKLNFASVHDSWMGEYGNMVSTSIYYRVSRELILEAAELFDHPQYIHLGMVEEGIGAGDCILDNRLNIIRRGKAMWKDLRFLMDCVQEAGAIPWIWHDLPFDRPEVFAKEFAGRDLLVSPWYYGGLKPEHYCAIADRQVTIDYYSQPRFQGMNLTYVEEDPFHTNFRAKALPCAEQYGYKYVPCGSLIQKCYENYNDMVEYFAGMPEEQLVGFIASAWRPLTETNKEDILQNIHALSKAKYKIFGK